MQHIVEPQCDDLRRAQDRRFQHGLFADDVPAFELVLFEELQHSFELGRIEPFIFQQLKDGCCRLDDNIVCNGCIRRFCIGIVDPSAIMLDTNTISLRIFELCNVHWSSLVVRFRR